MVRLDTSLVEGILAPVVLLLVNTLVARLRMKWLRLHHWVEGTPALLTLHGETIPNISAAKGLMKKLCWLRCANMA